MKKKVFVDIVMPNHNKGRYITKAIKSVINQSFRNWKLFIIDDNSNDKSNSVLEKFKKFKKIKIIKLNRNLGPGNARNIGMSLSKSKYLSFLDSDDFWTKKKLENQIKFMEKFNLDFTYTDYITFFENKKKGNKTNLIDKIDYKIFLHNSSINTSTMILKKKIVNKLKFDNTEMEDYVFKCKLLKKGIVANKFNRHSAYYRISKISRSSKKLKNVFCLWRVNKKYNKLSFFKNIVSLFLVSINSIKKYGFK